MESKTFKAVLIIVTLVGMGIGLVIFGWNRVRTDRILDKNSDTIEGRVVDSWVHTGSRGGEWPTIVVKYSPPGNQPITRNFDVNQSTYQTALETRKVTVHYWPDDPNISRIVRFETLPFQILIGLGGFILFAGLVCLLHFMRSTRTSEVCKS